MVFQPNTSECDVMDGSRHASDLHEEVRTFVAEWSVLLLRGLRRAADLAPDIDRGVAALSLAEARQAQFAGLWLPLPAASPSVVEPSGEQDWGAVVTDITVGARLRFLFFAALQEELAEEQIPVLEIAVRRDPPVPEILWADAIGYRDRVNTTVLALVDGCTRALRDRRALSAVLGHDGTLSLFAVVFEALREFARDPNSLSQ